jgi:predicted extracellular nuclease
MKKLLFSRLSFVLCLVLSGISAFGQAGLVISQIYGGGGNASATYNADFVELYNATNAPISTAGLSVQYASAAGNFTQALALTAATIPAGHYFLVQTVTAGTVGASLPTPDTIGTAPNLSASAGKVALVNGTAALSGDTSCALILADTKILDFVGYGSTASCFPGSGSGTSFAPGTVNNASSIVRTNPAANTGDNSKDFSIVTPPNPHNSSFGVSAGALSATGSSNPSVITAGGSVKLTIAVTPGTSPTSTGITVTGDLRQIGGIQTQAFTSNGDGTYSYTATVTTTAMAVLTLPATVTDAQGRSASPTIALTVNQPVATVAIHTIQGSKSTTALRVSPLAGQTVTTTGVVTAVIPSAFFIQSRDVDADGDPTTPEGIQIFTGTGKVPAIAVVGNYVSVTGTVATFPAVAVSHTPATEITSPNVTLISTGTALPTPITLTAAMLTPSGGLYQLTPYEGMRVAVPSLTTISGTNGSITDANEPAEVATSVGYFYTTITGTARPFREPGIDIRDPAVPGLPANVASFDDNPERILVDSVLTGGTSIEVSTGAVLANVTGVLDFTFSTDSFYDPSRLILDATYNRSNVSAGMTVQSVALPAKNEFTVASFNIERFYNTNAADDLYYVPAGVGGSSAGKTATSQAADVTATAYTRRLQKLSLAVRNVLNSPDVVTIEEVENQSVATDIANQINADAGVAGLYTGYSTDNSTYYTQDGTGISVGFLVKNTVNSLGVTQFGQNEIFTPSTSTSPITLNDRPWLVLSAGVKRAGAKDYPVTVIVNHMKALTGENSATSTSTRQKKELQAEDIAKYIQTLQAAGKHVISGGDFNAFEFSDGYIDALATYTNVNVLPASQVLQPGVAGLVTPPLVDMALTLPANQRWSYVEDGSAQILDHMVVTPDLVAAGAHFAYAHMNADFPLTAYNDATTPARNSDHDAAVGYFVLPTPVLSATLTPPSAAFGTVTTGLSSSGQVFTLTNTGEGAITFAITTTGDFAQSNNCGTSPLAMGGTCSINVVFSPTTGGTRTGALTVVTNGTPGTLTSTLSGTGLVTLPTLSSSALTFAASLIGTASAAQTITVTNTSALAVPVAAISITGDYSQTNTCGTSIAGGKTCAVAVVFKPTGGGPRLGTLTVTTAGASATTLTASLTGSGLIPNFTIGDGSGSAATTLTVVAGGTATTNLTFTPLNGFTGTVTITCATPSGTLATGVVCVPPSAFTLSGAAVTQTVTFTTTARSQRVASGFALTGGNKPTWMLTSVLGLAGLLMLFAGKAGRGSRRVSQIGGLLTLLLALCMPSMGCGSGSTVTANPQGTPAGTYTYLVNVAGGAFVHAETVTLIVQ